MKFEVLCPPRRGVGGHGVLPWRRGHSSAFLGEKTNETGPKDAEPGPCDDKRQ